MNTDTHTPDDADLHLPAELGIYAAADVCRAMAGALANLPADSTRSQLRVEAARVETVDASGVQLLIALAGELQQRGLSLQWINPSRALREGAARLGAVATLHLQAGAQGANQAA